VINCHGNSYDLLSFFNNIRQDSIINTSDFGNKNIQWEIIDDSLVIRHFLSNKEEDLYYTVEEYNMDNNTYSNVIYKRKVFGLFSKKIDSSSVLICYYMDGVYYLSIFNMAINSIVANYKFGEFPDESESFTQSILFANYIFTIETTEKTRAKLIEIDYINGKFNEHKNIIMDDFMIIEDMSPNNEKYNKALKLAGISETGELLEDNP
jgi:hypothetical protein